MFHKSKLFSIGFFTLLSINLFSFDLQSRSFSFYKIDSVVFNKESFFYDPEEALPTGMILGEYLDLSIPLGFSGSFVLRDELFFEKTPLSGDFSFSEITFNNYIEELYFNYIFDNGLGLELGKVNPIYGIALGYNPTDHFERLRVAEYKTFGQKQGPGVWLARSEILFDWGGLGILYSPEINFNDFPETIETIFNTNDNHRLLVTSTIMSIGDIIPELSFYYDGDYRFGLTGSYQIGNFIFQSESSLNSNSDNAYFDMTNIRKYPGYIDMSSSVYHENIDGWNLNTIFGVNYISDNLNNFSIEYAFKGGGYTKSRWDEYLEAVKDGAFGGVQIDGLSGEEALAKIYYPGQMAQHYLYLFASYQDLFINGFKPSCNAEINLVDKSFTYGALLKYEATDNVVIESEYRSIYGEDITEFGNALFKDSFYIALKVIF